MSHQRDPGPLPSPERSWRERWDSTQSSVRARFGEPIDRATRLTQRTLAWFPVRVWRHFLQHNGFLLAAGMSYQSLFAIFGALYLSFAAVGVWLGGSDEAIKGLIGLINRYIPGLISDHGLVKPDQVTAVAEASAGILTITGAVAVVVVVWTAIGFVTYTRRAIRDTFGLPFDRRSYVLLKARDLLAAALFGVALLAGAVLASITTGAVDLLFRLIGVTDHSTWLRVLARVVSVLIAFALNSVALASLFRFLIGVTLTWRRIWPGALLGAAGMVVLQIGAGFLIVYTPSNPLLATFAVFIGFLLWFRLNSIVILVAAAWIATAAADRDENVRSAEDRRQLERAALLIAAEVRVREAELRVRDAPWYRRWWDRRTLAEAHRELAAAAAVAPPGLAQSLLD